MERDYIGNLKVLAAINRNSVSRQNLVILGEKYSLSEAESQEMIQYCKDNGIDVYDEVERESALESSKADLFVRKKRVLTEEEKEFNRLTSFLSGYIMRLASTRALKITNGHGWLCGTYTGSIRKNIERYIKRCFSHEELEFIVNHLSDPGEDVCFALEDREKQDICEALNDKLNKMIPHLYVNHFYDDY